MVPLANPLANSSKEASTPCAFIPKSDLPSIVFFGCYQIRLPSNLIVATLRTGMKPLADELAMNFVPESAITNET
jgi:hypothetical protein